MRAFVDTNVLIRYLVNEPLEQADRVQLLLESEVELILPDLIVAEVAYVLASYKRSHSEIATAIRALLTLERIIAPNAALLLRSADLFEQLRLDFADAYLLACAEASGDRTVVSFDRGLGRLPGVTRRAP